MLFHKKSILIYLIILISFFTLLIGTVAVQMNIPYSSRAHLEYQISPLKAFAI